MNEGRESGKGRAKREAGYSTVPPYGGGRFREADTHDEKYPWLKRSIGIMLLASLLAVGVYFAADPVKDILDRPLASVMVEGDFKYISKQRAMDLITAEIHDDFLQLDLMEIKAALEREPWIEQAAIARRWPDALDVKITEQQPIARWGTVGFLSQRGEVIRVGELDELKDLPLLQGSDIDAGKVMQQYQDLSRLLRSRGLDVIALQCDTKKSWRLTLKNDVEIAIGRYQVMEKITRFVTVYDQHLQKVWPDVESIDVRYTNGIAVRWSAGSNAEKLYIKSM